MSQFDALESVRRLIRTGNDKSFWRKREAELLARIEARSGETARLDRRRKPDQRQTISPHITRGRG